MTVDSTISTAEAQAKTVEVEAETFFQKYKTVIFAVLAFVVGLVVGHKL